MRKWLILTMLILIALLAALLAVMTRNADIVDQRKASQAFKFTATAIYTLYVDCMGTKTGYECEYDRDRWLGTKTVNPTIVLGITTQFAPRTYPPTNTATQRPTITPPVVQSQVAAVVR